MTQQPPRTAVNLATDTPLRLYDYPRSTACYRVRIALALKQLPYECENVHLIDNGGEQHAADYVALNPQQLVPTLQHGELTLTQSLVIIDYLDNLQSEPRLIPVEPVARAKALAVAQAIACDIHPLNNLRVLNYLRDQQDCNQTEITAWYHHWLREGFNALEKILTRDYRGTYCFGDTVSIADVCLIPQLYNAHRYQFALDDYPTLAAIEKHCLNHPAFLAPA